MTPIMAEINRWTGLRFVWGISDCVMIVADWVQRHTGIDPAADLRMTYGTAGECQRVTRFFTDPVGVIAPRMAAAGLPITAEPVRGDVGVLMQVTEGGVIRPHAGLCMGKNWAVLGVAGVEVGTPAKVVAAWAVGYHDA